MEDSILLTENLKKSFRTEAGMLNVLKGIDLQLNKGEFIAITGASGAGKSTLLHILGTIDRPTSGKVMYSGKNVFELDDDKLSLFRNSHVGFVFQFHHLLPEFSAIENIIMPGLVAGQDKSRLIDDASQLLSKLGILDRKLHRPGELSGGEQQRVAVARALILNPQIVLADEPTGNLDTATGNELFRILQVLNDEMSMTFVVVTHNEDLAQKCSRIIHMADGIISDN